MNAHTTVGKMWTIPDLYQLDSRQFGFDIYLDFPIYVYLLWLVFFPFWPAKSISIFGFYFSSLIDHSLSAAKMFDPLNWMLCQMNHWLRIIPPYKTSSKIDLIIAKVFYCGFCTTTWCTTECNIDTSISAVDGFCHKRNNNAYTIMGWLLCCI